ncbi:MAG: DNA repair protein RadA [Candidatus Midichloria sp.]|nr:MAG: DNA repair protein RadA [Candidatus Midichloria sp.]
MKKKLTYFCQDCRVQYNKWLGKCEECGAWNSIVAEEVTIKKGNVLKLEETVVSTLSSPITVVNRLDTGINEFNRVLGGGLVKGSAVLIAGEPGIGKSTLLLQFAALISQNSHSCLYVSAEESIEQLQMRAARLGLSEANVLLISTSSLTDILDIAKKINDICVITIDSIQTLRNDLIDSAPVTVTQVKSCTMEMIAHAKKSGTSLIIVGHVTKDGQIAGPKLLEHMVDTVIYFEGDNTQQFRIVRTTKNRYGPTNEIGIFEMSSSGLNEVKNPSAMFMSASGLETSGSCIFAGIEGTRPIMVEIQALVSPSFLATPRRSAVGWDVNRLAMMIAILGARYGLNLSDKEVYLNVVGGMKITEPAADLAVIAALISAASNIVIPRGMVFFGEVGLSGEVRQVIQHESRLNEATKLGIEKAVIPAERKVLTCNINRSWIKHIIELKKVINNKGDYKNGSIKEY